MKRIDGLDFLRGFSILLMFADHLLAVVFLEGIYPFGGRYWTRLSEPLFALLFGYFLFNRSKERLTYRLIEIAAVALLINVGFYFATEKLEILVSFILTGAVYYLVGDRLKYLVPAVFLYALDPTRTYLDYPLSLVLGQVALGMWIRSGKLPEVMALTLLCSAASLFINPPWQYTAYFTLPAALLVLAFSKIDKLRNLKIEPVNHIGRRPLFYYAVQYALAVFLGILALAIRGQLGTP